MSYISHDLSRESSPAIEYAERILSKLQHRETRKPKFDKNRLLCTHIINGHGGCQGYLEIINMVVNNRMGAHFGCQACRISYYPVSEFTKCFGKYVKDRR